MDQAHLHLNASTGWQPVGERSPTDLVAARLQLHWAVQLVSAVGTTLLPPAADDSHTNLEWLADRDLFGGRLTPDAPPCRAALRPHDLMLCVLDEQGEGIAMRCLHGLTLSQGMVWLEQEIAAFTERPLPAPLKRRELALPDHPAAHGVPFSLSDVAAFAELGRWYANADRILRAFAAQTPNASAVRCWPHHFDIATLVNVHAEKNSDPARTIGIGMSPGDTSYAEPYWYVTPSPSPENPPQPALDGAGEWHLANWFGAVLTGSKLIAAGPAETQMQRLNAFLHSAVLACAALT